MSDSLRTHELQHARLPCPSLSPGLCSNSCPLMVIPSNHLILSCPLLLLPSIFPSIKVFSSESALCIKWPKYWSFSSQSWEKPEVIISCCHAETEVQERKNSCKVVYSFKHHEHWGQKVTQGSRPRRGALLLGVPFPAIL